MAVILITGGSGFLGVHVARALVNRGDEVVVYDTKLQNLKEMSGKLEIVKGDILEPQSLLDSAEKFGVEKIIHTAALVGHFTSIEKPSQTVKVNIEGTLNVLEAARRMQVKRVLDFSSETVYGQFRYEPVDEDHPRNPVSLYGITKLTSEMMGLGYHKFYDVDYMALRTSFVYGPGMPAEWDELRARPPTTFIKSAVEGKPLEMEEGGDQKIDQTYVKDLVQGVLLMLDVKEPKHRIYNITSGKAYTLRQTAEMVKELVPGTSIKVGPGLLRFALGQEGAVSISRAHEDLGYTPRYDLKDGLKEYLEWYKKTKDERTHGLQSENR